MKRLLIIAAALGLSIALVIVAGASAPSGSAHGISYGGLKPIQKRLVSGALAGALGGATTGGGPSASPHAATTSSCVNPPPARDASDAADSLCAPDTLSPSGGGSGSGAQGYQPSGDNQCSVNRGDNVKVNQNCLNLSDANLAGRGQAQNEEAIAIDPNHPDHIVASQNDYRRGDGNCYGAYSLDGGESWNDTVIPMSFTRGTATWGTRREYWQAGGDTSVAWDSRGNAYFSCQVFNRGAPLSPNPDQSSAFYIFRSTGNNGASWNFPGRPVVEQDDTAGTGAVLLDKQYVTVDNHDGSPFRDRVYVTWTTFAADGTAYIYAAGSSDYGEHFSSPVLVSKDSPLCPFTYSIFGVGTPQGRCNENQFSNPFTGPDGALYVVWANYNTATANPSGTGDNRYQVLLAKSTDGGATFTSPVKVSDFYDLPDCDTYQGKDAGRACVPEKGPSTNSVFRATNYPVGSVNPNTPGQVVVTIGSYINQHSKEPGCTPTGFNPDTLQPLYSGVKPGPCNNDILVSVSNDGGATFTGTTTDPRALQSVNSSPDQAVSDQFWQWQAFNKDGKLAVDYYDRQYGKPTGSPAVPSDEWTGYSDITLSGSSDFTRWGTKRVTSSSMPPPTQFAGTFYGDYIGMDASNDAVPIWSDTRDLELFLCPGTGTPTTPPQTCTGTYSTPQGDVLANDENSYAAVVGIPSK